jgi:hypothetical protein
MAHREAATARSSYAVSSGRAVALAVIATLLASCGGPATSPAATATPRHTASPPPVTPSPSLEGEPVEVVAGNGKHGSDGDGGPALDAMFEYPSGLVLDDGGDIYVTDDSANDVRRIDADGTITTVAGDGSPDSHGDGGPAIEAGISSPDDVVIAPDGTLYIAESDGNRVRRVTPDGIITTYAGNGAATNAGDGGPATRASISVPDALALADDGTLFVSGATSVRRIDSDGTISTVAGNGEEGWDDKYDGKPATEAAFTDASSMVLHQGNLYLADFMDCVILKIDRAGDIHRVAGIGCASFEGESTGDGGMARSAGLARPADIAFGPDGSLYILEHFGGLRRVAPDGTISTLALAWKFEEPLGMTIDGPNLYIADRDHFVLVKATLPSRT